MKNFSSFANYFLFIFNLNKLAQKELILRRVIYFKEDKISLFT
ncbi:MAG: hypothetical protein ACPGSG_04175 [Prolixibacteraceae bacterium]|nr:hypothetical protein [Prolixibacteraceae bacterium]